MAVAVYIAVHVKTCLLGAFDDIAKVQHIFSSHKLHAVRTGVAAHALDTAWLAAWGLLGCCSSAADWPSALSCLSEHNSRRSILDYASQQYIKNSLMQCQFSRRFRYPCSVVVSGRDTCH